MGTRKNDNHTPAWRHLGWFAATVLLAGCVTRPPAVPRALQDQAVIPGMTPAVRTWGWGLNPDFEHELLECARRELAYRAGRGETGPLPPADFLAISGGGQNGAFAAGLLCGWTAAGNRP